jgi:hypothetical protein
VKLQVVTAIVNSFFCSNYVIVTFVHVWVLAICNIYTYLCTVLDYCQL